MTRSLLQIVGTPEGLLSLTQEELAWALLEDMQARLTNPVAGMARRDDLSNSLLSVGTYNSNPMEMHQLASKIDRAARNAFDVLVEWKLIEPAPGANGRNGFLELTDRGKSVTERTDFERVRVRSPPPYSAIYTRVFSCLGFSLDPDPIRKHSGMHEGCSYSLANCTICTTVFTGANPRNLAYRLSPRPPSEYETANMGRACLL